MLSETHITNDFTNRELVIDGYALERCDSESRHTGVIMYLRNDIKYKVTYNKQMSKTWILTIQISESLINGYFTVLYKSPKEKINDFIKIIDEYLEENINNESKNIIVGDFNIDVKRKNKNAKKYLAAIEPHNLNQIINDVTRHGKNNSQTIIDHVLTNSNEISYNINKEESITDHFIIEIKCSSNRDRNKKKEKLIKTVGKDIQNKHYV